MNFVKIKRFFKYPFRSEQEIERIQGQKMALFFEEERKAREEKGILDKPGRCEFTCPNCGKTVVSVYYEPNSKKLGDLAGYLHGGCFCSKCRIGIRI